MTITTTGVVCASYEAGIAHLKEFALRQFSGRFNYCMLMREDDETYKLVERIGMPCWGALREYHSGTSPDTDYWPDDLRTDRHIFPKTGRPVAVSTITLQDGYLKKDKAPAGYVTYEAWNQFMEFVYDKELSPFRRALKNYELLSDGNVYRGVIILDTNINPSDMLGLFRCNAFQYSTAANFSKVLADNPGIDKRVAYLKASRIGQYYLSEKMNLKLFFNGQPRELDEGKTFYSRQKYNRPEIEFIFDTKDKNSVKYKAMSIDELNKQLAFAIA